MIHTRPMLVAACLATLFVPPARGAEPAATPGAFAALASPAAPGSGQPNLAVAPDGAVWLSWLEPLDRGGRALRAARLEGGRWSTPLTVVSGDSLMAIGPDIPAVLPLTSQRVVALYLWHFPGPGHAREVRLIQTQDGGKTWGVPVVANRDRTPTEHGFASLVADPKGARAVWLDGRNSAVTDSTGRQSVLEEGIADMVVRTAVLTAAGTLTDERELDGRACDCCPTAAAAMLGGSLVAYRDRSAGEVRDISIMRYQGGAWTAPVPVHADGWKIEGCPVNGPAIAVTGGRIGVAWYTGAQDKNRVQLAFSDDGGQRFGAPVRLDQGSPTGRVSLAMLSEGGAQVAWLENANDETRLVTRRITRNGEPGPVATVATIPAGRGGSFPHMVRSRDQVVLTWTEPGNPARVRTALARLDDATAR
jgi:hypothetical protein